MSLALAHEVGTSGHLGRRPDPVVVAVAGSSARRALAVQLFEVLAVEALGARLLEARVALALPLHRIQLAAVGADLVAEVRRGELELLLLQLELLLELLLDLLLVVVLLVLLLLVVLLLELLLLELLLLLLLLLVVLLLLLLPAVGEVAGGACALPVAGPEAGTEARVGWEILMVARPDVGRGCRHGHHVGLPDCAAH